MSEFVTTAAPFCDKLPAIAPFLSQAQNFLTRVFIEISYDRYQVPLLPGQGGSHGNRTDLSLAHRQHSFLIPHSSNIRPIQLQGFARIALESGQTKTVTTRFYVEQLDFYSHNGSVHQWNIEPGTYTLKVGASSADIRLQQQLILRGSAVTKPLRDHYFSESLVSL